MNTQKVANMKAGNLVLITCYTLPPTQHHSFFRNLPLYSNMKANRD